MTNPTGLTIAGNETGTISVTGTPTTAGTVTFTVTPTDAIGTGTGTTYSFAVNPGVALSASTLPAGEVGLAYTQSITGTDGSGAITLAVSGVTNPTGLTIAGSGTGSITLSGTPTGAGTVTFTVTPTDAIGTGAGTTYSFVVNSGVALSPTTLPGDDVGLAYTQSITGTGGSGAITLAVSGVTNPTGLTIAGSGTGTISLTGTPTGSGTVTFTVTPTDAIGTGTGTTYSFAVNPGVALSASTLPAGEVGLAYTQSITGPTGPGPSHWPCPG
ncbi:Fibronectin type III domain protein [Fimbriiglobus ruber]|uniref:Fibronectin type III domain protein n=1 Tax=Fimbriiglobus ruber TaxID=1908690 RepID=A0A225DPP5_9BACT|nr:putative Ig domain-containing protein [Fimbriiglobus ruber]OWK43063.1 Fibronectin type III domain protein [Fimbriiglobus ruber]